MAYSNNYYQANRTQRPRGKWWIPKTEEQRKLFDAAKDDVLCFLTINLKEGVKARFAYSRMTDEMDSQIDYKKMGFNAFSEFLYHIDDILSLKSGPDGDEYLFLKNSSAADNDDISHITALVKGQSTASKRKGVKVRQSNSRFLPSERLLSINCERGMAALTAPSASSSIGNRGPSLRPKRISGPRGRQRPSGQSRTRNMSSFRTSNSIPTLKPLNASAVSLVNSRPMYSTASRSNVPTLRPLSSQPQNQTRSVMMMNNGPTMRPIPPRYSTLSQPSTTPKLRPLSELRKTNPPVFPPASNSQENRSEQQNLNGAIPKPTRPSVPQLKPLSQILRTIPNNNNFTKVEDSSHTNMEEDENDAYSENEEDSIEYSGDESEEFNDEENDQNENLCTIEQDECDGDMRVGIRTPSSAPSNQNFTAMTQYDREVLGGTKDQTTSSTTNYQRAASQVNDDKRENVFKFSSVKNELESISTNYISSIQKKIIIRDKKIYKQLKVSQMSLNGNTSFKGELLGSDQWGFLFVKRTEAIIENSFKVFHRKRQEFYSNPQIQEEYRMDPNMIENGVYVVAFVESSGLFIRARIAESLLKAQDFCIVFDIDDCDYHFIPKKNIYHTDVIFTLRHPQAIMVVLRNTEKYVLTAKFEELVSPGFEKITQTIFVTDITSPDRLFRVPIVSIKTEDGQDLYEILKSCSPELESKNTTVLTSLTNEQQEIFECLKIKGHLVSTISL